MVVSTSMTRSFEKLRFLVKTIGEHPVTLEQIAQGSIRITA
jgi:hypothetical protein